MFPRPPYKHDPEEEETGFSEKIMLKQNDNAQVWFNQVWFNQVWFNQVWFNQVWFDQVWFNPSHRTLADVQPIASTKAMPSPRQ